ncbi:MAG: peptide deformylase [Candidatus Kapaibacteriota bacterium]
MAIKPIYNCFHPVLNKPTTKVENIDFSVKQIANDLIDTLKKISNGVGLAANQIGATQSVLYIDISIVDEFKNVKPIIMINPEIIKFSEEKVIDQEGCLSIPDFYEEVERPDNILVKYYDLQEKEHIEEVSGYLSRVMQHEIDHLNGILFYQRLSPLKKTLSKNKLNKIKKGIILPDYPFVLPDGTLVNS